MTIATRTMSLRCGIFVAFTVASINESRPCGGKLHFLFGIGGQMRVASRGTVRVCRMGGNQSGAIASRRWRTAEPGFRAERSARPARSISGASSI